VIGISQETHVTAPWHLSVSAKALVNANCPAFVPKA
jgi:hypothetical protein